MITLSIKTIITVVVFVTILQTIVVLVIATDNRISNKISFNDFGEAFLIIFCGVPAWISVFYNCVLRDAIRLYRFNKKYCYCHLIKDEDEVARLFLKKADLIYFEQSNWFNTRIEVDDTLKRGSMGYVDYIENVFPKPSKGWKYDLTPYLNSIGKENLNKTLDKQ